MLGAGRAPGTRAAEAETPSPLKPGSIPVADLPRHFDVEPGIHNLENGYWGIMPRQVAEVYAQQTAFVNRTSSIWARNALPGGACLAAGGQAAREAIARQVGCLAEEIAVTRSGAEALEVLITRYKGLKPGDAVIHCDLDYDDMIAAMEWLGSRRGAQVVRFAMPEPATTANILAAYRDVLTRTPNAKLLLVTQVSNRTGLVTPVREIVAMARERGVDTVVDAAHGIACLDFKLDELGADFVGWSVHKWTSAPLGTGAMYIRKGRLADIDVADDLRDPDDGDITTRVPSGTINFAAVLTIPTAVDFHFAVGAAAKEKHMRGLRNRWVGAVHDLKNVEICVPDDAARYCTITSFRLKGMKTNADAQRVQRTLFEKHNIHTVWRKGVDKGPVIRVTPGLYSTTADVDALVAALRAEHAMFA
ncbi:aminotransferase class V-fold PLP-dependent enzyme [Nitrospirillum amazonense]|uniref:aminotransferase class V-fold PLP-dependent enzyme n=1 Tax=Nitrospirillum amazonense TaxID=28077 RepID=UPI002DD44240|nr:aminotransferase class V-fold PLP-dependent enzyme [Nitrospirillum amazonense]MEC4589646.1 aminotransferase class V-fold PLP-dependent enzyme [Nitrospirillum amazonense]